MLFHVFTNFDYIIPFFGIFIYLTIFYIISFYFMNAFSIKYIFMGVKIKLSMNYINVMDDLTIIPITRSALDNNMCSTNINGLHDQNEYHPIKRMWFCGITIFMMIIWVLVFILFVKYKIICIIFAKLQTQSVNVTPYSLVLIQSACVSEVFPITIFLISIPFYITIWISNHRIFLIFRMSALKFARRDSCIQYFPLQYYTKFVLTSLFFLKCKVYFTGVLFPTLTTNSKITYVFVSRMVVVKKFPFPKTPPSLKNNLNSAFLNAPMNPIIIAT